MGYPTKVQLIQRKKSNQWYVGFPAALAAALGLRKSEVVEWRVEDRTTLVLTRRGEAKGGDGAVSSTGIAGGETGGEEEVRIIVPDPIHKR